MRKKIVGIFIVMLLMTTVNITVGSYENQNIQTDRAYYLNTSIEVVDQHNPFDNIIENDIALDIADEAFAQSFIPEHTPLTKIRLNGYIWFTHSTYRLYGFHQGDA